MIYNRSTDRPMTNKQFIEAYADITGVEVKQAKELVKYFRALIYAAVRAHGSVHIDEFGTFTNRWWVPRGKLVGLIPSNRMVFIASRKLSRMMSLWPGCPGFPSTKLQAMREAERSLVESFRQSPDAEHDPQSPPAASAD